MLTYKEKLAVISQMIQLSKVDGVFHEKERQFVELMATEYNIKTADLNELMLEKPQDIVFHSNFQRIEHFYKMALLMHSDKSKTDEELVYIKNLGLKLGLSPFAVQSVMDQMQNSESNMLSGEQLLNMFKSHEN
jgi:uncharacterized membrane protein YebE (DUF533 family)